MLPSAAERRSCPLCPRGAASSSLIPSSPFCPGKPALARWRQREVWCPRLCGEWYQRELSGDVIRKLLLPRRDLQSSFGRSSATQAHGHSYPSRAVGARLKQWGKVIEQVPNGVLKTQYHPAESVRLVCRR